MNKPPKWGCEFGCDVRTRICKHIEKKLPQMGDGRTVRASEKATANLTMGFYGEEKYPTASKDEFLDAMRLEGFVEPWDLELLGARYCDGHTIRRIAELFNYVSFKTVHRRLQHLHTQLLERGYKPKERK